MSGAANSALAIPTTTLQEAPPAVNIQAYLFFSVYQASLLALLSFCLYVSLQLVANAQGLRVDMCD